MLSCRPKLEMEELFDATIPKSRRYKTRFVFRQVLAPSLLYTHPLWAGLASTDRQYQRFVCTLAERNAGEVSAGQVL